MRDLSGGERRRLQLMRLLMGEPNVLLLDEPTNDLDIDTLTALEDLLDGWPGTLVVVSHDRYFVERVCDDVYALAGDGAHPPPARRRSSSTSTLRRAASEPPRARRRRRAAAATGAVAARRAQGGRSGSSARSTSSTAREAAAARARWPPRATDHVRLRELSAELEARRAERDRLEAAWLEAAETLD